MTYQPRRPQINDLRLKKIEKGISEFYLSMACCKNKDNGERDIYSVVVLGCSGWVALGLFGWLPLVARLV